MRAKESFRLNGNVENAIENLVRRPRAPSRVIRCVSMEKVKEGAMSSVVYLLRTLANSRKLTCKLLRTRRKLSRILANLVANSHKSVANPRESVANPCELDRELS